MGLFGFSIVKSKSNHAFDEKDRELSAKRRRDAAELDALQKENRLAQEKIMHETRMLELKMLKEEKQQEYEDLLGEEEDILPQSAMSEEGMMFLELLKKVSPASAVGGTSSPPPVNSVPPAAASSFSDIWANIPPNIKALAKTVNDEQLKEFIKVKIMPTADDTTLNAAVQYVRTVQ